MESLVDRVVPREPWFNRRNSRIRPNLDLENGLDAPSVLQALNHRLPLNAIVSADIGNHRLWVCDQLDITRPERLLQSCEFDAMGFSLPAAIGAAIAEPGTRVVSISGDGGFVHTMGELAVAAELGLPVTSVVFVDGALGILKHQAEEMYGKHDFVRLAPIDFAKVANGFGIESRTVATRLELEPSFEWAINHDNPSLLAIEIDPDEVFPPLRYKIEQRKRDLLGE